MKNCPFCREEIQDEAIKCKFCSSFLVPIASNNEDGEINNERVTYVLDKGLIRFAKFSAAVLAIFLVVGAYLFGFKLESALQKVSDTQVKLNSVQDKLSDAQVELEQAKATVVSLKQQVESVLVEAKSILGEISTQRATAIDLVVSIRELNQNQLSLLQKAKGEKPDKFRQEAEVKYWAKDILLRVKFLDGNKDKQQQIREISKEWFKYAGLRMEFVESGPAEIRISFKSMGSWSFRGTDALGVPDDEPTMNFGWIDRRTVLHEFGHALGLIEEHLNPDSNINWNKELVYKELGGPPNHWSKEQIVQLVFRKIPKKQLGQYRQFDPESIMTMKFPSEYAGGLKLGASNKLSESDKILVSKIYPRIH